MLLKFFALSVIVLLAIGFILLFIWLFYFKLKIFSQKSKNKILLLSLGISGLAAFFLVVNRVAPHSKELVIAAKARPLTASVTGKIETIFIAPNQSVKKGEPLFQVGSKPYESAVELMKGNFAAAQVAFERSKEKLEVAQELHAANQESISQFQMASFEENFNRTKSQLQAAQMDLDVAEENLIKTTIYAPSDGFVPFLTIHQDSVVNPDTLLLDFFSSERSPQITLKRNAIFLVQVGDPAEIVLDLFPGEVFQGVVEEINWAPASSHQMIVKLKWVDPDEKRALPTSQKGEAVLYTQYLKPLHIVQKVYIRMQSWLKYLV